jgi:FKBP-type peptidyl-prolyl cis-trans isomerase
MLRRGGQPVRQRVRPGLGLLLDTPGTGELVRRQCRYLIRLRLWVRGGEPVRWETIAVRIDVGRVEDGGETLICEYEIHRRSLINGLFYGVEGMRVGGTRRLEIAPHLAWGERGIPGRIPPNADLTAEITILEALVKALRTIDGRLWLESRSRRRVTRASSDPL